MDEPTLLQQARQHMREAYNVDGPSHEKDAISCVLHYLTEREANMSGPAQVPGEPKCKVCGFSRDSHAWRLPQHDFEPDIALCKHLAAPADFNLQRESAPAWESAVQKLKAAGEDPNELLARAADRLEEWRTANLDLDLDELQRLCDAATPGPWHATPGAYIDVGEDEGEPLGSMGNNEDARFVAAARDALPKLIAKVRELEGHLEVARPYVAMYQLRTGHQLRPGQSYSQGISAIEADDDDE